MEKDCAIPSGKEAILAAAAHCFMEAGFSDTSIDDVAEHLGATKGRIYHYYRSKADLFFEVQRRGMAINISSIEPLAKGEGCAIGRLTKMSKVHLGNMLNNLSYQRVVSQGVEMHLAGSTTPKQRKELKEIMIEREYYEGLFKQVLIDGREQKHFVFENSSFASKAVLGILNNPVLWYKPKVNEKKEDRLMIVEQFSTFAINSVLAKK